MLRFVATSPVLNCAAGTDNTGAAGTIAMRLM
jgi:hypothetical protein